MTAVGANYKASIFRKDFPMVMATNRASAVLLPVTLRYDAAGYPAGQVVALNTVDSVYDKYVNGGASGTGTAAAVLFFATEAADFTTQDTAGRCIVPGIFGGCVLYKDRLTGIDSAAITSLKATSITDAFGINLLKF